jgi:hypothetical protein
MSFRLANDRKQAVDEWAVKQPDKPKRSEALRRLVEHGLRTAQLRKPHSKETAAKASKFAGREIDKVADKSASAEVREKRKRRLLKGPKEFRNLHGNRNKLT